MVPCMESSGYIPWNWLIFGISCDSFLASFCFHHYPSSSMQSRLRPTASAWRAGAELWSTTKGEQKELKWQDRIARYLCAFWMYLEILPDESERQNGLRRRWLDDVQIFVILALSYPSRLLITWLGSHWHAVILIILNFEGFHFESVN